jgi:hypothetical protein
VHHLARQIDPATKAAREALDLARRHGERGNEAEALRVLGEVAIAHGDMTAADAHLRDSVALAQQLAMRPLVAHCHLGLGKLSRLTGVAPAWWTVMDFRPSPARQRVSVEVYGGAERHGGRPGRCATVSNRGRRPEHAAVQRV